MTRTGRADSPLLSENQARYANSRGGLNLAAWHATIRMEDVKPVEVWNELMAAIMKDHRGDLLKELVTLLDCEEQALGIAPQRVLHS